MPRGEPPLFTSNPAEKPGCQTCSRSTVPGNVSASPAVAIHSVQATVTAKSPTQSKSSTSKKKKSPASATTVAPKSPTQSKSSTSKKKKTKGDNVVTVSSPASATTAPKSPTQSKTSEKNKASAATSTSTALLPSAPRSLSGEKKREQIQRLAKALKAASPCHPPVVVAPKEAAPALAATVSTALGRKKSKKKTVTKMSNGKIICSVIFIYIYIYIYIYK
jgi:DNA mismatch repair ATPase MutL